MKILLVEDNEMDVRIATRAFKQVNKDHQLFSVKDGQQALDYLFNRSEFEDCTQYPRPDFILMDINMPRMNGLEALRKIKNDSKLKSIPVGMLTSSNNESDIIESYSSGACGYIRKPVQYEDFVQFVRIFSEYWLVYSCLPRVVMPAPPDGNDHKIISSAGSNKILIVDDDAQHIRLMSILLAKAGYKEILTADSGEKALEVLMTETPAVVILDTILPKRNGFEICTDIKNLKGDKTKVILNTGMIDAVNARLAKEVGADDYLPKTLDSANLMEAVKKYIPK
ncbi:MAG: response regulator [Candidatus Omnitrophica bacterium]|nr:response regulator [Candidatus Omnitrophota bacterium]